MSDKTAIEWTDSTWNPIRGCSRVSEGCSHCYAESVATRFGGPGLAYEGLATRVNGHPAWTGEVRLVPGMLDQPLRWQKPRRIFVNSMSDLFHEKLTDAEIASVFAVMADCFIFGRGHTFQILTKRAERMRDWFSSEAAKDCQRTAQDVALATIKAIDWTIPWPLPNVWIGVSVENQRYADERIPLLLETPAAVRFLSVEPLLGPISIPYLARCQGCGEWLNGSGIEHGNPSYGPCGPRDPQIDLVIVGGESGPKARPSRIASIRAIVRQCKAANVPVFVKQLGTFVVDRNDAGFDGCDETSWPCTLDPFDIEHDIHGYREEYQGADCRVRLRDRKGGDPEEWPEDLRVREFPAG